ncbi:MAG: ribonuclease M5 [Firmicutes bacterium]|nr:ribonuclease M5 [Bacillota bacterium]
MRKKIKEAIIVEGRDDTTAIGKAVDAVTIETHGFGMPDHIWPVIDKAYKEKGIIVFTDPDYAGEKIRRKIVERYPECKQAFLPKGKALKKGNIGVENAKPEDIIEALENAHCTKTEQVDLYTKEDLFQYGLVGTETAKEKREKLGNLLSIGYGNSKTFLKKLNQFQIPREEFLEKLKEI